LLRRGINGRRRDGKREDAAACRGIAGLRAGRFSWTSRRMLELLRTTDPVLISFVGALLKDAGIPHHVADSHMSILDGSIGILPRRILVEAERIEQARRIVRDAELGHELV
jgi:hypothetical protein